MAVPTGTASLLDIQNEFGGAAPISLSEYYGAASGVPTSGAISINNFRGKSSAIVYTATGVVNANFYKPDQASISITDHATFSNVVNTNPEITIMLDGIISNQHLVFCSISNNNLSFQPQTWVQGVPTLEIYFNDVLARTYTASAAVSIVNGVSALGYYEANMAVNFGQYIGQTIKLRFVYQ